MPETTATQRTIDQASEKTAIRPFRVNVPETELTDLRRRINATKWPDRETVPDATQGVQLATMQALARYWATEYDWRKVEARLNTFCGLGTAEALFRRGSRRLQIAALGFCQST